MMFILKYSQSVLQNLKKSIFYIITVALVIVVMISGYLLLNQKCSFGCTQDINYALIILRGHKDIVTTIAITPEEKTLISGSHDQTIKLWDLTTGKLKNTLNNQSEVTAIALSSDGKTLISGGTDQKVKRWNLGTQTFDILSTNEAAIKALALSANEQIIAVGSGQKIILLNGQKVLNILQPNSSDITTIAITSDNQTLISGSLNGKIQKFNLETGKELNNSVTVSKAIKTEVDIAIDQNNINFFVSGCNQTIHKYDLKAFQEEKNQGLKNSDNVCVIDVNNKNIIAGATLNGKVQLWNFSKLEFITTLSADENKINDISFSKSGKILAVASDDHTIKVWNLENLGF